MTFEEYFDTITDYEADYSLMKDAWNMGAYVMYEHLMHMPGLDKIGEKNFILKEVEKFMKKNG